MDMLRRCTNIYGTIYTTYLIPQPPFLSISPEVNTHKFCFLIVLF